MRGHVGSPSKVLDRDRGSGLSYGAEAAVSRVREAAVSSRPALRRRPAFLEVVNIMLRLSAQSEGPQLGHEPMLQCNVWIISVQADPGALLRRRRPYQRCHRRRQICRLPPRQVAKSKTLRPFQCAVSPSRKTSRPAFLKGQDLGQATSKVGR